MGRAEAWFDKLTMSGGAPSPDASASASPAGEVGNHKGCPYGMQWVVV